MLVFAGPDVSRGRGGGTCPRTFRDTRRRTEAAGRGRDADLLAEALRGDGRDLGAEFPESVLKIESVRVETWSGLISSLTPGKSAGKRENERRKER